MSSSPPARPGLRQLLRHRDFRLLWLGQSLSNFGDGMNNLALLVLIEHLTGSTTALATAAVLMALPRILLGPLAGVYADRYDRKKMMALSDLARGFLVLGYLLVHRPDQLWILYGVGFLEASVSTFFAPARGAFLADLLPAAELLTANSLSQTSQILMNLLGMAAAGAVIGAKHIYWPAFGVDSLSFFLSMTMMLLIRTAAPALARGETTWHETWQEIRAGGLVIFRSRVLMGVLAGAALAMLGVGAINILFVPLLLDNLHVAPTWLSAVQAAQTAGMLLSGGVAAALAAKWHPTRVVSLGLVGVGVGIGLMGWAAHLALILGLLFMVGLFVTPLNAAIATLTQTAVAETLRGRVGASLNMLVTTANIASMAMAGVLADWLGVRSVFVLAGVVVAVAGFVAAWLFRGLGQGEGAAPASDEAPG